MAKYTVVIVQWERPVQYDDGERECYRVRLHVDGEIRNTGVGFESLALARVHADGMSMALSTLFGPVSVQIIESWKARYAPSPRPQLA